jgi:Fe-S cluster assembly protein SufD
MTSALASTTTTAGFTEASFAAFLKSRDEPGWLVDRRRSAFEVFSSLSLPSMRDEEWRRTDIRAFRLASFAPPNPAGPTTEERAATQPAWDALAGHYGTGIEHINTIPTRSADPARLGGAILLDLATAAKSHPEILERYFLSDPAATTADAFSALHAAFWTGGTLLYVPKGVKVELPLFSLVALAGSGSVDLDHTLVVLEEGAEATLVRETASVARAGSPALHCGAVELFVNAGAKLQFVNIQNWDDATWTFSRERAIVAADAQVQWTVGALGSRVAKVNQEVALAGKGADAQVNGVMFTTGKQHLAYFTRQDHEAPHTRSDLLYKAGLKGRSRIVWKGMIRVEKDAQRTDAYQKDDNLILSDAARADSIPGLEIEANDVRCTHGATAGRVDEEMVFYAQARGVKRDEAIRLIVEGFFANVYDRIQLEPVRETLRQAVAAKLEL